MQEIQTILTVFPKSIFTILDEDHGGTLNLSVVHSARRYYSFSPQPNIPVCNFMLQTLEICHIIMWVGCWRMAPGSNI